MTLKLKGDHLWALKGLANALEALGQTEAAREKYRQVITESEKRGLAGADDKSLIGWCYYRVGEYEAAARVLRECLNLDPKQLSSSFDLALAQMCNGEHALAEATYRESLDRLAPLSALKRRGLLFIALDDLKQAMQSLPALNGTAEAQASLQRLEAAWQEVREIRPVTVPCA